jgi:CRISPR-associated protein Cas1
VGKRSEHLTIHKDGVELGRVPLHAVRQVVVMGNVQVSTQALETLATNEIPVMYLTGYGRFIAALVPAPAKNVSLREAQFRRFADRTEAIALAKAVVRAKLHNQRTMLMRCLRGKGEGEEESSRGSHEPAARDMAELIVRLERASEMETMLGLEGRGRRCTSGSLGGF